MRWVAPAKLIQDGYSRNLIGPASVVQSIKPPRVSGMRRPSRFEPSRTSPISVVLQGNCRLFRPDFQTGALVTRAATSGGIASSDLFDGRSRTTREYSAGTMKRVV